MLAICAPTYFHWTRKAKDFSNKRKSLSVICLLAGSIMIDFADARAAPTTQSPNYSGYVDTVTKGRFTYTSGSFVVPTLEGQILS
jgi:hypothetical protein